MNDYLPGLLFAVLLLYLIFSLRKKYLIRKIRSLPEEQKLELLSSLTQPAGFSYLADQDIFVTTQHAWQRDFGYCSLYDDAAPLAQMVFDREPVYFYYRGTTWLIEFWKGQYGINTGAEIGVYRAEGIIPEEKFASTLFQAVSEEEGPILGLRLSREGMPLFRLTRRQWWLGGFRMGLYSQPESLLVKAYLTFPNKEMAAAFLDALKEKEYCECCLCLQGRTVTVLFDDPNHPQTCRRHPLLCRLAQHRNRMALGLYNHFTKPFTTTVDRLAYLYYLLPCTLRRLLLIRSLGRRKLHRLQRRSARKSEKVKRRGRL